MSHLLSFLSGAVVIVGVFLWHNRLTYAKTVQPNQWKRYRGIEHLRQGYQEPAPISTAELVLDLRRNRSQPRPAASGQNTHTQR